MCERYTGKGEDGVERRGIMSAAFLLSCVGMRIENGHEKLAGYAGPREESSVSSFPA